MLNKNELANILKERNRKYFEVLTNIKDLVYFDSIELSNLDEFMNFIDFNKIYNIYLKSEYYSAEHYLISEKVIELAYIKFCERVYLKIIESDSVFIPLPQDTNLSISDEILMKVKNKINKYNKEIENIDFSNPHELLVFAKFNNIFFYFTEKNKWFDESKHLSFTSIPFSEIEEMFSDDYDDNEYVKFLFDFMKEFEDDIEEDLILQLKGMAPY